MNMQASEETPIANPSEAHWIDSVFQFYFGAYGETSVYVIAKSWNSAFEAATEWLDDNAPGHLTSFSIDDYKESAEELGLPWLEHYPNGHDETFLKIVENAEVDHMVIGHTTLKNGTHVCSWECTGNQLSGEEAAKVCLRAWALTRED